eukprot:4911323-Amphidinium_carterae.1
MAKVVSAEVTRDINDAIDKYDQLMRKKCVDIDGELHEVGDTLFSGDPLTQFFNTVINIVASAAAHHRDWKRQEKSIKGDDAGSIHASAENGQSYLKEKAAVGVTLNEAKIHSEPGMVELEIFEG